MTGSDRIDELLDEASRLAEGLAEAGRRDRAFRAIAIARAMHGDGAGAASAAHAIADAAKRSSVFRMAVESCAAAGDVALAMELREQIGDDAEQVRARQAIAEALARLGDRPGAIAAFASARQASEALGSEEARRAELRRIVKTMVLHDLPVSVGEQATTGPELVLDRLRAGDLGGAKAIAERIVDRSVRRKAVMRIAEAQAQRGDAKDARDSWVLAASIIDDHADAADRATVAGRIVRAACHAGDVDSAIHVAASIADPFRRAIACAAGAATLDWRGADDDARRLLARAEVESAALADALDASVIACLIVREHAWTGNAEAARATAERIADPFWRVLAEVVLAGAEMVVAETGPARDRLHIALRRSATIADVETRECARLLVAQAFHWLGDRGSALQSVDAIAHPVRRAFASLHLAGSAWTDGAVADGNGALAAARAAVESLPTDHAARASLLQFCASHRAPEYVGSVRLRSITGGPFESCPSVAGHDWFPAPWLDLLVVEGLVSIESAPSPVLTSLQRLVQADAILCSEGARSWWSTLVRRRWGHDLALDRLSAQYARLPRALSLMLAVALAAARRSNALASMILETNRLVASAIRDLEDDEMKLSSRAQALAEDGDLPGARSAASKIADPVRDAEAARAIALAEVDALELDAALATSRRVVAAWDRVELLRRIAEAHARLGDRSRAAEIFDHAGQIAMEIPAAYTRGQAIRLIVESQARSGDLDGAAQRARAAEVDVPTRIDMLVDVARIGCAAMSAPGGAPMSPSAWQD